MSDFTPDLLRLSRAIMLSPTDRGLRIIAKHSRERLFTITLAVGLVIGAGHASYDLISGARIQSLAKIVTFPIVLTSVVFVWSACFSLLGRVSSEKDARHDVQGIFLASSTFLLPGAIPGIGLIVMPALLLGWPYVIARYTASRLDVLPGHTFIYLVVPPVAFWCVIRAVFYFLGIAISN